MTKEVKIYQRGLEEFPKVEIAFANLVVLFWIVLGTISCWFFSPIIAWAYLVLALIMVFLVLRKLVCTNCYYYDKWCCLGWGKISALFFKKGDLKKFGHGPEVKIAPLVYGLLSLIPLIFIITSIVQEFTVFKITILILLLLVTLYSGVISRKKACSRCKMRLICPGSVVK